MAVILLVTVLMGLIAPLQSKCKFPKNRSLKIFLLYNVFGH